MTAALISLTMNEMISLRRGLNRCKSRGIFKAISRLRRVKKRPPCQVVSDNKLYINVSDSLPFAPLPDDENVGATQMRNLVADAAKKKFFHSPESSAADGNQIVPAPGGKITDYICR